MKVRVADLKPNPFRNLDNYPINRDKVQSLKNSIEQTGFWDNLLARQSNGSIEIAYGHHRLVALQELDNEMVVDIPVRALDDVTMIKIMANENMDDWAAIPSVIDETVRVAKSFLESNPEERKKITSDLRGPAVGAILIGRFLGWEKRRSMITHSLKRIKSVDTGLLDNEAVKKFPSSLSAHNFSKSVQYHNLSITDQKKAAKAIVDSGDMGKGSINQAILNEKFKGVPQDSSKKKKKSAETVNDYLKHTNMLLMDVNSRLEKIQQLKEENNLIISKETGVDLVSLLGKVSKRIHYLFKPPDHVTNEKKEHPTPVAGMDSHSSS